MTHSSVSVCCVLRYGSKITEGEDMSEQSQIVADYLDDLRGQAADKVTDTARYFAMNPSALNYKAMLRDMDSLQYAARIQSAFAEMQEVAQFGDSAECRECHE